MGTLADLCASEIIVGKLNKAYDDGYKDGYADAIVEFAERITLPLLTEEDISRILDEMKGVRNE